MIDAFVQSSFHEVAALLALAAAFGFIGSLLRQPPIVSYIAAGIVAGPFVLHIARSDAHIDLLSEIGVSVLLFLVGIKLDVKLVRTLGPVATMTGLGQVLFTSLIGFAIAIALGFDAVTSIYVAVALTFSSTIIIVKLLSDKREIDSLHGQVAIGFLIVQDLVVVFAMLALSAVGIGSRTTANAVDVLGTLGAGMAMIVAVLLFVKFVADPLTNKLARSSELLVGFAIALAVLVAALGDVLGFGKELGGLLAGVALASTPYRDSIAARLAPLRDFLLLFFFVALGTRLDPGDVSGSLGPAIVFSTFVLIGNPLIVLIIMGALGYRKRTGFLAGLTVAQISEFSLIFMALGVSLGHVAGSALNLVTLVGLITITASTYMITYSHQLYALCEPLLGPFERRNSPREPDVAPDPSARWDVILFGLGRYGSAIGQRLIARGLRVLGVDFNPAAIRQWRQQGLTALYGDATDPEFVASLPQTVPWAVSAVPYLRSGISHDDPRWVLIRTLRERGFAGRIAVTCHDEEDAALLRSGGADVVLAPFQDAAARAAQIIADPTE